MSLTTWQIKAYDLSCSPLSITDMLGDNSPSEMVRYADDRLWSCPLNGLDTLSGKVLLQDPASAQINAKTTIMKMWRSVSDADNGKYKAITAGTPDFAGPVISTAIDFASGYKTWTAVSPLWRLQLHFHIQNHHILIDTSVVPSYNTGGNRDNLPYDQSALMWRLIDLINGAFLNTGGDTGIRKPPNGPPYWPKTVEVAPYFVAKGSNTWSNIFEDLMQREGGADIVPEYIHTNGDNSLMYFKTDEKRGTDISASTSFDYHTGNYTAQNLTEDVQLVPGKYGNYVWVVGDGGPNAYVSVATDVNDRIDYGIYMKLVQIDGAKKLALDSVAPAELGRSLKGDAPVYTVSLMPLGPPYFKVDYDVGDVVKLNAAKGYWSVSNVKQRIYQVDLKMTKNNVELPTVYISDDFTGAVAT